MDLCQAVEVVEGTFDEYINDTIKQRSGEVDAITYAITTAKIVLLGEIKRKIVRRLEAIVQREGD